MSNIIQINQGVTRIVFKLGAYVVKIPNFKHSHLHFLNGCYANWSERNYCKTFENMYSFLDKVAPSIFCSYFGLIQIQRYCVPLGRELTKQELKQFDSVRGGESKSDNFGIYNGHIVCVDYP